MGDKLRFDFNDADSRDVAKITHRVFDFLSNEPSRAHLVNITFHEAGKGGTDRKITGKWAAEAHLKLPELASRVAEFIDVRRQQGLNGILLRSATVELPRA